METNFIGQLVNDGVIPYYLTVTVLLHTVGRATSNQQLQDLYQTNAQVHHLMNSQTVRDHDQKKEITWDYLVKHLDPEKNEKLWKTRVIRGPSEQQKDRDWNERSKRTVNPSLKYGRKGKWDYLVSTKDRLKHNAVPLPKIYRKQVLRVKPKNKASKKWDYFVVTEDRPAMNIGIFPSKRNQPGGVKSNRKGKGTGPYFTQKIKKKERINLRTENYMDIVKRVESLKNQPNHYLINTAEEGNEDSIPNVKNDTQAEKDFLNDNANDNKFENDQDKDASEEKTNDESRKGKDYELDDMNVPKKEPLGLNAENQEIPHVQTSDDHKRNELDDHRFDVANEKTKGEPSELNAKDKTPDDENKKETINATLEFDGQDREDPHAQTSDDKDRSISGQGHDNKLEDTQIEDKDKIKMDNKDHIINISGKGNDYDLDDHEFDVANKRTSGERSELNTKDQNKITDDENSKETINKPLEFDGKNRENLHAQTPEEEDRNISEQGHDIKSDDTRIKDEDETKMYNNDKGSRYTLGKGEDYDLDDHQFDDANNETFTEPSELKAKDQELPLDQSPDDENIKHTNIEQLEFDDKGIGNLHFQTLNDPNDQDESIAQEIYDDEYHYYLPEEEEDSSKNKTKHKPSDDHDKSIAQEIYDNEYHYYLPEEDEDSSKNKTKHMPSELDTENKEVFHIETANDDKENTYGNNYSSDQRSSAPRDTLHNNTEVIMNPNSSVDNVHTTNDDNHTILPLHDNQTKCVNNTNLGSPAENKPNVPENGCPSDFSDKNTDTMIKDNLDRTKTTEVITMGRRKIPKRENVTEIIKSTYSPIITEHGNATHKTISVQNIPGSITNLTNLYRLPTDLPFNNLNPNSSVTNIPGNISYMIHPDGSLIDMPGNVTYLFNHTSSATNMPGNKTSTVKSTITVVNKSGNNTNVIQTTSSGDVNEPVDIHKEDTAQEHGSDYSEYKSKDNKSELDDNDNKELDISPTITEITKIKPKRYSNDVKDINRPERMIITKGI